jgi:hypothetical protein
MNLTGVSMLKKKVTAQDVCDLLNDMLVLDRKGTTAIVNHRHVCNKKISDHPTLMVRTVVEDKKKISTIGLIGILNGIFGIRPDGMGDICYDVEKGKINSFKITPAHKSPYWKTPK